MDGKVGPSLELIERNWMKQYEKFFFMNNYGIILSENMPEIKMTPELRARLYQPLHQVLLMSHSCGKTSTRCPPLAQSLPCLRTHLEQHHLHRLRTQLHRRCCQRASCCAAVQGR